MALTAEQADWMQDALAFVQVIRREGAPPMDPDAMEADVKFLFDPANETQLAGVLGCLGAMVAEMANDEQLEEIALRVMEQRAA